MAVGGEQSRPPAIRFFTLMRNIRACEAEIRELYAIQKGLPKSPYRERVDKRIHELRCKVAQLKKEKASGSPKL